MKIVLVSSHYPPNFISGGTLVPQRTGRVLASRGHEVKVFAGWIGDGREGLETWDEPDDGGLAVRWIVSTPWMSWSDVENYDNPAVTNVFRHYLESERPDIVHFHSLQTLGVGLVEAAAELGVPTVLTMHDFWWVCGRQFLCTEEFRPCCLVVDAGACSCQVSRPWADQRRARTLQVQRRVDVTVAVSAIEAEVLKANGLDPSKIVVIENGLPAIGGQSPTHRDASPALRFTFAGGTNPMKGFPVLREAARVMSGRSDWELSCYGCEGDEPFSEGAVLLPAFSEDELQEVLARTDVLILPSVMRETYSILTREALQAGVPVICSDCLGPEEVVLDGLNGLVVPSGDPVALAAAMTRLLDDADLLRTVRSGTGSKVPMPSLLDQVDALENLYELTVQGISETKSSPQTRTIRRVLFVVGIEGAPLRYRARLPAEALEGMGVDTDVRHYRHPDISRLADEADAVIIYRVPATVQINHLIAGVQRRGVPVLFDVDDLIFDPDIKDEIPALKLLPEEDAALWVQGILRYRTTLEQCDAFVGSTAMLCRRASEVTGLPSFRYGNGVGNFLGRLSDEALDGPRRPGPLRIGYLSGTDTHDNDWRFIEPAVARVLDRRPDVELWLVGLVAPSDLLAPYADRIIRRPLLDWHDLPQVLRDLDVNLAPLEPSSRFNEAKSAIKWLEAALTATPTVASPTEPFREVIVDGFTGLLATDGTAWCDSMLALLDDPARREAMGRRARRSALLNYSAHLQGPRYKKILEEIELRTVRHSSWKPVANDEPFAMVDLEEYGLTPVADSPAAQERVALPPDAPVPPRSRRDVAGVVMRSLARDGPVMTVGRIRLAWRKYLAEQTEGFRR